MAKNFHYFKFIATEWLTGDIVFEDFELQGIFINVCALYWHRDGKLSVLEVEKRLKTERLFELAERFILIADGFISIKFLDEQLIEAGHVSKVNSENGKLGGRPKKESEIKPKKTDRLIPLSEINQTQSEYKANESQIEIEINKIKRKEEEPQQMLAFLTSETQLELGAIACKTTLAAFTAYAKGKAGFLIATTEGKYSKQTLARIIIQDFEKVRNEFEVKTKIKVPEDFWSKSEYEAYCKQNNLESQWD